MAKYVYVRIDKKDKAVVLDENMKPVPEAQRDIKVKRGKKVGQAFWFNENPTCVFIGGKWY